MQCVFRLHNSAGLLLSSKFARATVVAEIPRESAQGMRVMRALLVFYARGYRSWCVGSAWLGLGSAGHRRCALLRQFRLSAIVWPRSRSVAA